MIEAVLLATLALGQPRVMADFTPPQYAEARRLYFSGQFRQARERFHAADRTYREKFGYPAPIYLGYLGLCHQALDEYDEAEAIFRDALRVIGGFDLPPDQRADMLVNLGTLSALRRDHVKALSLFDEALPLLARPDASQRPGMDWWLTGRTQARRTHSLITLGRYGEARKIVSEALAARNQFRDRMANFELLESAGRLHEVLGETASARAKYHEALAEAARRDGHVFNPALMVGVLRRLSNLVSPDESLRLLRTAIDASGGYGSRQLEIDSRITLAKRLIQQGFVEPGLGEARRAAELARSAGLPWIAGEADVALGRGLLAKGEPAAALKGLLSIASSDFGVDGVWGLQMALSDAFAAVGNLPASVEAAERGFRSLGALSLGAIRDDTQAAYWAGLRPRLETTLERLLAAGLPDAAVRGLRLVHGVRGRAFLAARRLGDHDLSPELATIEREVARIAKRLRTENTPAALRLDLSRRLSSLQDRWRTVAESRGARAAVGIDAGTANLTSGHWDAVLVFLVGERSSFRFHVDRAGTRLDRLPGRAVLERDVQAFLRAISTGGAPAQRGKRAAELGQLLLPRIPFLSQRPARVLLHADAVLASLPFEALQVQGSYLLEKAIVAYSMAGSPSTVAPGPRAALSFFSGASDLQAVNAEQEGVSEAWRSSRLTVYSGDRATEKMFRQVLSRRGGIVHVASHAVADPLNELASSVALKPTTEDDGTLYLTEIARTRTASDLVVLAACETAAGRQVGSEGAMSLGRAFLASGANAVVASQWRVSDVATGRLMQAFYRDLARGSRPDEALRAAKLHMLASPSGRDREPHAWAGFTLTLAPPVAK